MSPPTRALSTAVAVLLAASLAGAETAAWDQARATQLAQRLAASCSALYDAFYKQPVPGVASGQALAYQKLKDQVRRIRSEARALARALEKGKDRAGTQGSFDLLLQMVRGARDSARKVFNTAEVQDAADAARAALTELSAFYGSSDADVAP